MNKSSDQEVVELPHKNSLDILNISEDNCSLNSNEEGKITSNVNGSYLIQTPLEFEKPQLVRSSNHRTNKKSKKIIYNLKQIEKYVIMIQTQLNQAMEESDTQDDEYNRGDQYEQTFGRQRVTDEHKHQPAD